MEKKKIYVNVSHTEDNYCCGWEDGMGGTVLVTAKTLSELKKDFEESLVLHIEGCVADGDNVPEYFRTGEYEIQYELDATAVLRNAETYTTISAISRASGINQKQLSHYANGVKHPRPRQLAKIKDALYVIGSHLMALS